MRKIEISLELLQFLQFASSQIDFRFKKKKDFFVASEFS